MGAKSVCIKWMWYVTVPNPASPDLPSSIYGPFGSQSEALDWIDAHGFAKAWGAYAWQCQKDDDSEPTG